jgi:hypothetical protein
MGKSFSRLPEIVGNAVKVCLQVLEPSHEVRAEPSSEIHEEQLLRQEVDPPHGKAESVIACPSCEGHLLEVLSMVPDPLDKGVEGRAIVKDLGAVLVSASDPVEGIANKAPDPEIRGEFDPMIEVGNRVMPVPSIPCRRGERRSCGLRDVDEKAPEFWIESAHPLNLKR